MCVIGTTEYNYNYILKLKQGILLTNYSNISKKNIKNSELIYK